MSAPSMGEVVQPAAGRPETAQGRARPLAVVVAHKLVGALLIVGLWAGASLGMYLLAAGASALFAAAFGEGYGALGASVGNIVGLMLVGVMVLATLLTMAERKWSAMMQDRMGPNRARLGLPGLRRFSLWGLPHTVADVAKMLFKEDFAPGKANRVMFALAPLIAFAAPFCLFAVVPVGPRVEVFGRAVPLWVAPGLDVGLLFVFAMASLAVFGTALAGWASNNKLALLGGMRASAQLVSYEVTLGLTLVGCMIAYQSLVLDDMIAAQGRLLWGFVPAWGLVLQPIGLLAYFAAAGAEIKRAPFDMPEGESEIIGYFVEYSGLKFGLFMIAEFVEVVVFAGVLTAVFLGGWHLPPLTSWLAANAPPLVYGVACATVFWLKVLFVCWLSLAVRWTFPRFRYDQVMHLGWKILLPLSLVNVMLTAALVLWDASLELLGAMGLAEIALVAVIVAVSLGRTPAPAAAAQGHGGGH